MEQRIFKFRGKRTDGAGNWVHGSLVTENQNRSFIISSFKVGYNSTLNPVAHLVIPKTVSQSTGLMDSKVKEIYEGDKLFDGVSQIRVVEYQKEHCAFFLVDSEWNDNEPMIDISPEYYEVIGNIHQ